jgi:hypothetical protein
MITIFCDFRQFSAKKIGVFFNNQCYAQFFHNLSFVLSQKCQFFADFFGKNVFFLNHNIGPCSVMYVGMNQTAFDCTFGVHNLIPLHTIIAFISFRKLSEKWSDDCFHWTFNKIEDDGTKKTIRIQTYNIQMYDRRSNEINMYIINGYPSEP